jgi:hypothetical protein
VSATADPVDMTARYRVAGYPGVAFSLAGHPLMPDGDGEWIDNPDRVLAVMVGDDRAHDIDLTDLTLLDELDYCAGCGQLGCTADGRERRDTAAEPGGR